MVSAAPSRLTARDARSRVVEAARARARAIGAPVLLRWLEPSEVTDPWVFLGARARAGDPFWLGRNGEQDLTIAAVGGVGEIACNGAQRFTAAADLCLKVLEQGYEAADGALPSVWPAAVGGFAFGAGPLRAPWQDWPAAWFFVPRALWIREAGRSWVGVNVRVNAHTSDQVLAWALGRIEAQGAARPGVPVEATHPVEDEGSFCARVEAAVARLSGDLEKIVLARAVRARSQEDALFDVEATWRAARARDDGALAFALGRWGGEAFVGATPERLVEVDGRRVSTAALAGTAPRSREPHEDRERERALLASAKDGHEHAVVVASLRAALTPSCAEVDVAPIRIRSTADVHHLECRIEAVQRQPGGLFAWAERLHPTPAVAGHPRAAALAHLERHEPFERGYYAGAVGYATAAGDGALWVAIRSALLSGRDATLYAGAGLVPQSEPAAEWRETEHKLAGMQAALRASTPVPA